jgi:uncharacterized protein YkvS
LTNIIPLLTNKLKDNKTIRYIEIPDLVLNKDILPNIIELLKENITIRSITYYGSRNTFKDMNRLLHYNHNKRIQLRTLKIIYNCKDKLLCRLVLIKIIKIIE